MTKRWAPLYWLAAGAALLLAVPLYVRISQTMFLNSDDASPVLEGSDLIHGNWLLHGWTLPGDTFYLVEIPVAAVIGALRGVDATTAHAMGAVLYAAVLVVSAVLASRGLAGRAALIAAGTAAAILLVPAGFPIRYVVLGPYHVGTTLAILLALWVIAVRRDRVRDLLVFVILAGAGLSDPLAIYIGCVGISAWLLVEIAWHRRADDAALLAVVAGAAVVGILGLRLVTAAGGFQTVPLAVGLEPAAQLLPNLKLVAHSLLLLFNADPTSVPALIPPGWAVVHLAILAAALAAAAAMAVRMLRKMHEAWIGMAFAIIAIDVAETVVSSYSVGIGALRYVIPAYALIAVVAARGAATVAPLRPAAVALAAALVAQVAFLVSFDLQQPVAPSARAALESYLVAHQLRQGFGGFWDANAVTLETEGRVVVRSVLAGGGQVRPYHWLSKDSWYQPGPGAPATFVLEPLDGSGPDRASVLQAFGPPAREEVVAGYRIEIWQRDLAGLLQG